MENKIISVIVPVYNVEKYLSECIESIIDQTYLDLEIILINDGSTDGSFDICKEYEKRDSRIKLIDKINGGLSSARNAGIDNASGAYLCFVDSDDCLEKDALMQLYQAISESDISICSMSSDKNALTQGVSPPSSILTAAEAIKLILQEKRINTSASGKLFKTSLFDGIYFPQGLVYEDYATIYKVMDKAQSITVVDSVKYYYRYNPSGITKSKFNKKRFDYLTVSAEVQNYVKEKYPKYEKYVKAREVRYMVSFFKDMSASGYEDKEDVKRVVSIVRKGIFRYLFSGYKLTSKAYGLFISIFPSLAMKLFRRKDNV